MREKEMFKVLTRILDKNNLDKLKKFIIYPENKGYVMYGEYLIKTNDGDFVMEKFNTYTVKSFNSLRNAIIWATLDKANNIMAAKKVEELDIMLASTDSHIQIQKRLLKSNKNSDSMSLAYTKLKEESLKKENITKELEYYVAVSKSLQERNFNKLTK